MARRVIWGMLLGGGIGLVVSASVVVALFGYQIVVIDQTAVDKVRDLRRLWLFLPRGLIAGLFVGALGGLVAKLPAHQIPISLGMAMVTAGACGGRLVSVQWARAKGTSEPSIFPTLAGALLAAVLVLAHRLWLHGHHPPPSR